MTSVPHTPAAENTRVLRDAIVAWFLSVRRSFPWRDDPSPYRVWISEIMAQQTRLDVVVPYFERFLARFPSVTALAEAPVDDVLALWSGLGYYTRARNLHAAARTMVERHGGEVPRDPEQLRALAGIGDYTAGAIASIAYGLSVPVLDGNVIRVLARVYDIEDEVTRAPVKRRLWALAASLVPPTEPRALNEGLMELGALVCTPTSPSCGTCPVAVLCLARARGTASLRPVKGARTEAVPVLVLAGLVTRPDGALLLVQNPAKGLFGGLWQAPQVPRGLPRAQREAPGPSDLALGLGESLGARVQVEEHLGRVEHVLSHRRMTVEVYRCSIAAGEVTPTGWAAARWVRPGSDLAHLGLATVTRKVLALALQEAF